jgi:hypothetical protein
MTTRQAFAWSILTLGPIALGADAPFEPVKPPSWVNSITRMAFLSPGQVDEAGKIGTQVVHTNLVWPYYPLRRDGGGLSPGDREALAKLVKECHDRGMKVSLGLPPFPSVALVKAHPDWRVHPDANGSVLKLEPRDDNLGTRAGCNVGPWGDYLIDVCDELIRDYDLDGYSFDGNYHPPICYCPACRKAYRDAAGFEIPAKINLDDLAYRKYLDWRGRKLEDHYRRTQARIKSAKPDAVLMSWTTNAGRYGHLLTSPRVMTARTNRLFDLPMQEWWLDESNQGASVAPAFGAAYLRGLVGGGPSGSEPYLMSRGSPYSGDGFPRHERMTRSLLVLTQGALAPQSLGWTGGAGAAGEVFDAIRARERWTIGARPMPWAAMLVSEATRQFVAHKDIAGRFLPHVFGTFRATLEEHRPLDLIADMDVMREGLARYRVLILPNAAALSDSQAEAIRGFVRDGGGLVATCETSLYDELGTPRRDFALADLFGVSFLAKGQASADRPELDANFARALDESYWARRAGAGTLAWVDHDLTRDPKLAALVPNRSATFRGPTVGVTEPADPAEVVARFLPEGASSKSTPAVIARRVGRGRVVYFASGVDAALWSYAYPYQRRLFDRAVSWVASAPFPIRVEAPMLVQATFFEQRDADGRRAVIHLFNEVDTAAHHGKPGEDVPLREETIPIHGIRVRFDGSAPSRFHVEPGAIEIQGRRDGDSVVVEVPPLERHAMVVAEWPAR